MLRLISVLVLGFLINDAFADEMDSDLDLDLEAFHAAPNADDNAKIRHTASFDALDEEEEFSMDLSGSAYVGDIVDPDSELEVFVVKTDTEPDMDFASAAIDYVELEEIIEEPTPVDQNAKDLDWNLDLSEDMEIGDQKISAEETQKSEAVNLDFLEE
jgi:hypothetical protein